MIKLLARSQERMDGIPSKRRDRPVAESLAVWEEMKKGSKEGVQNCLRFKMDMAALNKALRDPVAYRCNDIPHVRTSQKYKVPHLLAPLHYHYLLAYPMMLLATYLKLTSVLSLKSVLTHDALRGM